MCLPEHTTSYRLPHTVSQCLALCDSLCHSLYHRRHISLPSLDSLECLLLLTAVHSVVVAHSVVATHSVAVHSLSLSCCVTTQAHTVFTRTPLARLVVQSFCALQKQNLLLWRCSGASCCCGGGSPLVTHSASLFPSFTASPHRCLLLSPAAPLRTCCVCESRRLWRRVVVV